LLRHALIVVNLQTQGAHSVYF